MNLHISERSATIRIPHLERKTADRRSGTCLNSCTQSQRRFSGSCTTTSVVSRRFVPATLKQQEPKPNQVRYEHEGRPRSGKHARHSRTCSETFSAFLSLRT